MPSVCAIILDYFGSSKTTACLTSLLEQGLDTVMIVDNSGDQQANRQLHESLENFKQGTVPFTIHQIVNPQNLGYAAGVNIAIHWLEENKPHHYYLLINNDALATPSMLPRLLQYMSGHAGTALAAPVMDNGEEQIKCQWYQRFSGLIFSHYVIGSFPFLSGCCLLVDQKVIGNALFDEDFFMYGEDVELSWRLRQSGHNLVCVKQANIRHEGTGSSHQGEFFYEYHVVRGHMLLAGKLARRSWQIPFFYFGRLLSLSARAFLRAVRFRSVVPIKASLSAICHARQVMDKS